MRVRGHVRDECEFRRVSALRMEAIYTTCETNGKLKLPFTSESRFSGKEYNFSEFVLLMHITVCLSGSQRALLLSTHLHNSTSSSGTEVYE